MERGRLEIYTQSSAADGYGGFNVTQTLQKTIWCRWEYLTGDRLFELGSVKDKQPIRLTVRKKNNITNDNILKLQDKTIQIHSIVNNDFKTTQITGWL